MTSTKSEILALLKRNGRQSVGQLAQELKLAPVTIRQHLTHLERDGLVVAERGPANGTGRGHYVFRLTAKAHAAAFPRRSDRLVELLVREIGHLDEHELAGRSPRERTGLLLDRLAGRLAEEYEPVLRGWPLSERVAFVTEVMHVEGGFAECEETPNGYEIRDFNCLFHRLLNGDGASDVCAWHHTFLSRTLGAEVRVVPCPDPGQRCCRYLIEAPVAATAGARSP
jgi:predicted ArsR family transcriptional regulator